MPRFAANVSIMFTEIDFQDRFQAARGLLFQLRGSGARRVPLTCQLPEL